MKKLLLLGILGLFMAGSINAAAPTLADIQKASADTMTIDSQFSVTAWELIDSTLLIKTDTCFTRYSISGYAELSQGNILYIGFVDGGDGSAAATDTFKVKLGDRGPTRGKAFIPFHFVYLDSLIGQTDANDTIYVTGAVGGGSQWDKVMIHHVRFTAQVINIIGH